MMKYLRKAPTLIVLGVTGFVGYPIVTAERDPGPPKPAAKPAVLDKHPMSMSSSSLRDPFKQELPQNLNSTPTSAPALAPVPPPTTGNSANLASLKTEAKKGEFPELAAGEDMILAGMRLRGTFIDDREKLALIDNKVYARGDQLRGADGFFLPYVVMEVRPDQAVVRRGRRDFVFAFSDAPRMAGPRAVSPSAPGSSTAMAKTSAADSPTTPTKPNGSGSKGQPSATSGDPKEMILQLLSGLGNSSTVGSTLGSTGLSAIGGSGTSGDLNSATANTPINQSTISAGIDALMGKYDNIGRTGDTSTPSNPGGGTP